jgi:hypothetical protein
MYVCAHRPRLARSRAARYLPIGGIKRLVRKYTPWYWFSKTLIFACVIGVVGAPLIAGHMYEIIYWVKNHHPYNPFLFFTLLLSDILNPRSTLLATLTIIFGLKLPEIGLESFFYRSYLVS